MSLNAKALLDAAKRATSSGNLQSAETNLRLALSLMPSDHTIVSELQRVVDARERQRVGSPSAA